MKLIPDWEKKELTCFVCGTKKSVKYTTPVMVIDSLPILNEQVATDICVCNKCALLSIFTVEDPKCETH